MFVGALMETWRLSLDWEHQVNSLEKSFAWGTGGQRNYVRDLEEQRIEEKKGCLKPSYGDDKHKGHEG